MPKKKRKKKTEPATCSIEECEESPVLEGFCATHYLADWSAGSLKSAFDGGNIGQALLGLAGI
ncbi:MAG: hypothetical protein NWE76_02715, partial [Candidatus Bathyarchaeota archaeon]|nr:hypothetical protein [Candidatus Bathyarchaeota archaeon]